MNSFWAVGAGDRVRVNFGVIVGGGEQG